MDMKKPFFHAILIVILAFLFTACSGLTPIRTQPPLSTATPLPAIPTETETPIATATLTATQTIAADTPTQTALPLPTFPLELTQTPGIQATATAYAAAVTAEYVSESTLLGPMADMLQINQYFNPVGTPSTSWHGVPIMAQATAGQEFKADIYSYKATATLSAAANFYNNQAAKLNWSCFPGGTGYAGTGADALHNMTLRCQGFMIEMTSFDNDTAHVIVVINKAP
jgi:hypothetical protein